MAEAIWFYAKNDEQKGPVTPAQLKALATNGELLPTDLVWKEGMGDWSPASEVKGLFALTMATQPAASLPKDAAVAKEPLPEPPPVQPTPTAPAVAPSVITPTPTPVGAAVSNPATSNIVPPSPGSRWANPPAPPAGSPAAVTEPSPVLPTPTPAPTTERRSIRPSPPASRHSGLNLVVVGLLLIFGLRGCDSLGNRYAARLTALAELAPLRFDENWESKKEAIETRRAANKDEGLQREAELEKLKIELEQLNAKIIAEREQHLRTDWRELQSSARNAANNQAAWSFWRQLLILPATLLFMVGLYQFGSSSEGADRWLCWAMLAIIGYSLFVGGAAWQ